MDTLSALLHARKLIARTVATVTVLTVVAVLLLPRSWTTEVSFLPSGRSSDALGSVSGIASQLGISVGAGAGGFAPRFFESLVRSETVLHRVARLKLVRVGSADSDSVSLAEIFGFADNPEDVAIALTVRELRREVISARFDSRSGLTAFSVTTRSPKLTDAIAARVLEEVSHFLSERHQSRAAAERRFIESRLGSASRALETAELRLQQFRRINREYDQSAELALEHDRLRRAVTLSEQSVLQLTQAFEQASIEEVRDTPVVSLVDEAREPAIPQPRGIAGTFLIAVLLSGGLISAGVVSATALQIAQGRAAPLSRSRHELVADALSDLRRPWRLLL